MDHIDRAARLEEAHRVDSIEKARRQTHEQPDEDDNGRYCLDCGVVIPIQRIEAVDAVRCKNCQTIREKS